MCQARVCIIVARCGSIALETPASKWLCSGQERLVCYLRALCDMCKLLLLLSLSLLIECEPPNNRLIGCIPVANRGMFVICYLQVL